MASIDCYCDYEPATFYVATTPRARKKHRCEECSQVIEPGQRYERVKGKWPDGDIIATFVTCGRCLDLRRWVQNNVPCVCWAHGNMLEDCANAVEAAVERAPAETVGLRFGFIRRRDGHIAAARIVSKRARSLAQGGNDGR